MIYLIGDDESPYHCRKLEKVRAVIVIKLFMYFFLKSVGSFVQVKHMGYG